VPRRNLYGEIERVCFCAAIGEFLRDTMPQGKFYLPKFECGEIDATFSVAKFAARRAS